MPLPDDVAVSTTDDGDWCKVEVESMDTGVGTADGEEAVVFRSLSACDGEDVPQYRSLSAFDDDSQYDDTHYRSIRWNRRRMCRSRDPSPKPPEAPPTGVRLSRGTYAGKANGIQRKSVVRAKGNPISLTCSLVLAQPYGTVPPVDALVEMNELREKMAATAGVEKRLMDPDANLTTAEPLTPELLEEVDKNIAKKNAPAITPPIVGMVVG
jgi:hypothetical protein